MTSDPTRDLLEACAQPGKSTLERLELGATVWLAGLPAPAQPGTVALRNGNTIFLLAAQDIVECRARDRRYEVLVKADANMLVREDLPAKARELSGDDCRCKTPAGKPETPGGKVPDGASARVIRIKHIGETWWGADRCLVSICEIIDGKEICFPIGISDCTIDVTPE